MKIAFVGTPVGTTLHRINAMKRLGHAVSIIRPRPVWCETRLGRSYFFQTSAFGFQTIISRYLEHQLINLRPDIIWVNQGEYLGVKPVKALQKSGVPIICYLNDDPFAGGLRSRRFRGFRQALDRYDLIATVRDPNVTELQAAGARNVLRIRMSADEVHHSPFDISQSASDDLDSDVSFIGTWFPERGPFLLELVRSGVPLSIWGSNWEKAPEWRDLRSHFRGSALDSDKEYREAIARSKVNLGLLSKENRDTHTTRSIEIPAIGGLLCAERTDEHLAMYKDGVEAVFWKDAAECARQCQALMQNDQEREQIRLAGQRRALSSGYLNEAVIARILTAVLNI
jgi:spore maturation protein CgeB